MHPKSMNLVVNTEEEATINPYASFSSSGSYSTSDFKIKDIRLTVSKDGYVLTDIATDSPQSINNIINDNTNNISSECQQDLSIHSPSLLTPSPLSSLNNDSPFSNISASSNSIDTNNASPSITQSSSTLLSLSSSSISSTSLSTSSSASSSSSVSPLIPHSSPHRTSLSSSHSSVRPVLVSPRLSIEINSLKDLKILAPIGQGASGLVQSALHVQTGILLALKQVPVDDTQHKSKQLLTEIRTLHHNTCPHIVSFYGAFYQERSIYMVLEHMDIGSLADLLKQLPYRSLPEQQLSAIANQVIRGLHYLHTDRKTIHRDLKPSNILINSMGLSKLADFGVSGMLSESETANKKMSFVGTVTYMSPERIQSFEHSYDSDIWSLGVTLLECAIGHFPYAAIEKKRKRRTDDLMGIAVNNTKNSHINTNNIGNNNINSSNSSHSFISSLTTPSFSPSSSPSTPSPSSNSELYDQTQTTDRTPLKFPLLITPSPHSSQLSNISNSSTISTSIQNNNYSMASSSINNASLTSSGSSSNNGISVNSSSGVVSTSIVGSSSSFLPESAPIKRVTSFCFWDIHQRIVNMPAPVLPSNGDYSKELCDFIHLCLQKNPSARPNALSLLSHDFITKYANSDGSADVQSLAAYIQSQLAAKHAAISQIQIKQIPLNHHQSLSQSSQSTTNIQDIIYNNSKDVDLPSTSTSINNQHAGNSPPSVLPLPPPPLITTNSNSNSTTITIIKSSTSHTNSNTANFQPTFFTHSPVSTSVYPSPTPIFATTPTSGSSTVALLSPQSSSNQFLVSTPSSSSSTNSCASGSASIVASPHFVLPQAPFTLTRSTSSTLPSFHPPPRLLMEAQSSHSNKPFVAKRKFSVESIQAGTVTALGVQLKEREYQRENQESSKKRVKSSISSTMVAAQMGEENKMITKTFNQIANETTKTSPTIFNTIYQNSPNSSNNFIPLINNSVKQNSPASTAIANAFRPSLLSSSARFNASLSPFKYQTNQISSSTASSPQIDICKPSSPSNTSLTATQLSIVPSISSSSSLTSLPNPSFQLSSASSFSSISSMSSSSPFQANVPNLTSLLSADHSILPVSSSSS